MTSFSRPVWFWTIRLTLLLAGATLVASSDAALLARSLLLGKAATFAPAECDALKGHRVGVLCKPPASMNSEGMRFARIAKQVRNCCSEREQDIDFVLIRVRSIMERRERLGLLPRAGPGLQCDTLCISSLKTSIYIRQHALPSSADVRWSVFRRQKSQTGSCVPTSGRGVVSSPASSGAG